MIWAVQVGTQSGGSQTVACNPAAAGTQATAIDPQDCYSPTLSFTSQSKLTLHATATEDLQVPEMGCDSTAT